MSAEQPSKNYERGRSAEDDDLVAALGEKAVEAQQRREKLAEETDDLLDEIDDVLEEDAESFVQAYVQKGGQ